MEPNDMLIAMMAGWASLAGLMIGLFAWLRADMKAGEERFNARIDRLEARIDRLEHRLGAVEHDVARIGGLLEGLRESITDRARSVAAE